MMNFRPLRVLGIPLFALLAGITIYLWSPEFFVEYSSHEYEEPPHWEMGRGIVFFMVAMLTLFSLYFVLQRKKTRDEQRRKAEQLVELVDILPTPILGVDANGNINEWNQEMARITGLNKEMVMESNLVRELVIDEHKARATKVLNAALRGEDRVSIKLSLYTKPDNQLDVDLKLTTRRSVSGMIVGAVGIVDNLTEHHRQLGLQVQSQTALRRTMNLTQIGYYEWGEENDRILTMDENFRHIFGLSESDNLEDLIRYQEKLIHPDDIPVFRQAIDRYAEDVSVNGINVAPLDVEYRYCHPDGETRYIREIATPVADESGVVTRSSSAVLDLTIEKRTSEITDRLKLAIDEVQVERERVAEDLSRLVDTANAPIFGVDEHGCINEWNQQAATLTGYDKDEVMGRNLVADFITDEYKTSVREVLDKALMGEETANYEFPLYTKANNRLDVLMNSTTRRNTEGQPVGVVGVGQDITELKKSQAQVIQSSKLASLGEMATSVAHELNQPLNTIRMASSNISDAVELGKATQDYLQTKLERIDNQVERAASIINHMRMFGREANENFQLLDLGDVIQDTLGLIGEQFKLAGIEIIVDCHPQCPPVLGHRIQLEQVLINLITNARDAILENVEQTEQKIVISSMPVGNHSVELSVADTGGGMPEKIVDRIFDPFFTTKEMGKGTGLGLSVSFGIIRDMGGTLTAKNIDEGAIFLITLPVAEKVKATAGAETVAV